MMKRQPTDLPRADEMEAKAELYSRMADDLHAQAAKMRLEKARPELFAGKVYREGDSGLG